MLALWNAGLWVLRLVLGWVDSLAHPGPVRAAARRPTCTG